MRAPIVAESVKYRDRMPPFIPGRRCAGKERYFFAIFSKMTGAIAIARLLPAPIREKVLAGARDFLLLSF
jgi:TetR/AcrR family transcriptional repressor of nem operon